MYRSVLKLATKLSLNNRFLWFFGFLSLLGYSILNFEIALPYELGTSSSEFPFSFLYLFFIIIIILSIFFILGVTGRVAIIEYIHFRKTSSISNLWSIALSKAGKIIFVEISMMLILFFIILLLGVPIAILFYKQFHTLGFLALLIALGIYIPISIIAFFMKRFSYFYIVTSKISIWSALESSYITLSKKFLQSVIFGLIMIGVGLAFITFIISLTFMIFVFISTINISLNAIFGLNNSIALIGGTMIWLVLIALVGSAYEVFRILAWFIFFQTITGEKIEDDKTREYKLSPGKIS